MSRIYTIGYEGVKVEQLIETLQIMKVEVLADVRKLPLSRKKGLSKTALADKLKVAGIKYMHFSELGDPKQGRDAAKRGDWATFKQIYLRQLYTKEAQGDLENLLEVADREVTCMMCFERCATDCHRSYIADLAANSGFEVYNLTADNPDKYRRNDLQLPRYNPRESLPAAE